uniref:adhesion G-protein coupled receptor G6-like n=1 Tax=Styela clava TaxID=7725 RepID=UPI00193929B0|nr:adhesion G-protein coupled receptor G6-like [Styela clava]
MIVIFSILVIALNSEGVESNNAAGITSEPISDDVFDPSTCGEINLKETSGWITSPRYPNKYVQNTFCEWIINAKPDHVVEIKFHDFELGNKNNLDDYVLIYEEVNDEDGGSPTKYFDGSLTLNPNMSVTYRSKSNFVIVQFSSGSRMNFKGFNASYRSK